MNIDEIRTKVQKEDNETPKTSWLQKDIGLNRSTWSDNSKENFYTTLLILLSAGLDLFGALDLIENESSSKKQNDVRQIRDKVAEGLTFASAIRANRSFSEYEIQTISLGEESGQLTEVLEQLAKYFKDRSATRRLLTRVMIYPFFVVGVTMTVMWFMLSYVVPIFADVFKRFDAEIPSITLFVIRLSERISVITLPVLVFVILLILFVRLQKEKPWFRKYKAAFFRSIPWFGKLVHQIYLARFAQSMSLLLKTGTPLVDALGHTERMIRYFPLEVAIGNIRSEIVKGKSLTDGMKSEGVFGSRMVSLIKVAEEVNQLDIIMHTLSQQFQSEISHKTSLIASILEPMMIVFIAVFVAIVLVAMYLPLFELSNVIN